MASKEPWKENESFSFFPESFPSGFQCCQNLSPFIFVNRKFFNIFFTRIVIFLQPYLSVNALATGPDNNGTAWKRLTIPAVTALLSPNSFLTMKSQKWSCWNKIRAIIAESPGILRTKRQSWMSRHRRSCWLGTMRRQWPNPSHHRGRCNKSSHRN